MARTPNMTAQGFPARTGKDGQLERLTLANVGGASLALGDLDPRLAAIFQTGKLFAVVDQGGFAALRSMCVPLFDAIEIAGWRLRFDDWSPDTIMAVKFNRVALPDLAADLALWSGSALLAPNGLRAQRSILDAIAAGSDPADGLYQYFQQAVVGDPDWTGVLFLNVPVRPTDFPEPLRPLAAALGPVRAHHIAFDVTPVNLQAAAGPTPLSGVILGGSGDAGGPAKAPSLRLGFKNSAIAQFRAGPPAWTFQAGRYVVAARKPAASR